MSMARTFHIDEDELIQYALGTLKEAQLTMLTAHVSMCTECRARLGAIQLELAAFAASLPEEGDVPEGARQRFLAKLNAPATQDSRMVQAREQGRSGAFTARLKEWLASPIPLRVAAGALAAAVIFLTYDDLSRVHENGRLLSDTKRLEQQSLEYEKLQQFLRGDHTQQVTLHRAAETDTAPVGHAVYSSVTGRLVFTAANMAALPPGKAYELWLLPATGSAPVAAGTFVPDLAGNGAIIFPSLPENVPAKGFGITVEDAQGSAKPTSPILLIGE